MDGCSGVLRLGDARVEIDDGAGPIQLAPSFDDPEAPSVTCRKGLGEIPLARCLMMGTAGDILPPLHRLRSHRRRRVRASFLLPVADGG